MRPVALKLNLGLNKIEDWRKEAINIDPVSKVPLGFHTSYLRADYDDLDHYFEPECADTIWINDVTAKLDIDQLKRTLAQVARLLRPGGRIYVDRRTGDSESTSLSYFTKLIALANLKEYRVTRYDQRILFELGKD